MLTELLLACLAGGPWWRVGVGGSRPLLRPRLPQETIRFLMHTGLEAP